jgi:general secretion pathway protein H
MGVPEAASQTTPLPAMPSAPLIDVSNRAARAPRGARGFTLIEILVVIVIISIIIASATIAVGVLGRDRASEDQARRLWAVLQQAREEAELQGLDVGLYLASGSYEFLRFDRRVNAWQPIPDDDFYAAREMPDGLRFRATLDGTEIVLKPTLPSRTVQERPKADDREVKQLGADDDEKKDEKKDEDPLKRADKDNPPPQIAVLSSGEIMPFEIAIERDNNPAVFRVVGTPDNDLRVEQRDAEQRWQILVQTNPPQDEKEKLRGRK